MKWTRWATVLLVLAVALVGLAYSGPQPGPPETVLEAFAVGDHVTMRASRDGDTYRIAVLTAEELKALEEQAEQYAAKRQQYESEREELQEVREQLARERDAKKRSELFSRYRDLRPPSPPQAVYQVFTVGKDYLGVSSKSSEILLPVSSIREIRRRAGRP
jgi:hypothetical protein